MRTPNNKLIAKRREQIIEVSAALFATRNYHEVRMEEVAEKTGLAKGTLYNYFNNKEDLYISIITHRLETLLEILKERIDTRQTPLTNLRRIIVHIYSFMAKYPHFFQIWYREKLNCQRHSHYQVQQLYQEIKDLLSIALNRGVEEGVLREHTTLFVSDIIMGMIDAAVLRSMNLPPGNRRDERIRVFEFFLEALGTDLARQLHTAGEDEPREEYFSVSEK